MIRVILFDLGQVVIRFNLQRALQRFMAVSGALPADIMHFFTRSEEDRLFVEGKISGDDFFKAAKETLKLSIDLDAFCSIYNGIFELNKEIAELIGRLKQQYTIAALSNTNEFHIAYIEKHFPVMQEFDQCIYSYKEKTQKPRDEIFERALARLNMLPQECVLIDDSEENVRAAAQLGIRAIHYTTTEKLIKALEKCGVKV